MVLDELRGKLRGAEVEVPDAYRPYVGRYKAKLDGNVIEILVQSGNLALKLPDERIFELLPENEEGRWVFALTDQAAVSFDREDTAVIGMHFHQSGMSFELTRLEDGD